MLDNEESLKITYGMFICSLIIVAHHSVSHLFYSASSMMSFMISFVHYGLFAFTMPFFFFWSGYFCMKQYTEIRYLGLIQKKIKSLVIPYFSWNILWTSFAVILFLIPFTRSLNTSIVWDGKINSIVEGLLVYKYNGQYWYILNIIVFVLAFPLLFRLVKNRCVLIISCAFLVYISQYELDIFSFSGLVAFLLGVECFYRKEQSIWNLVYRKLKCYPNTICIVLLIAVCIWVSFLKIDNTFRLVSLASMFLFWRMLDLLINIRPSKYKTIIENHFFLYSFHETPQLILNKMFVLIPINLDLGLVVNFVFGVVSVVFMAFIINSVLYKKMPFLYSILNGNRRKHL